MCLSRLKRAVFCLLAGFVLAGILCVAGDIAAAWCGKTTQSSVFLLAIIVLTGVFFLLLWKKARIASVLVGLAAALALISVSAFFGWKLFSANAVFEPVDNGKAQLYGGKRVMMILPHQDDDFNVLGGAMEEFVRYGSELYPVYATNGDFSVPAETRYSEALAVMRSIGVPEENVIFLGYGDDWKKSGPHIYNAEPGKVMESYGGYFATYGTEVHGAYREGRAYTVENYLQDFEDVILEIHPDVIFCSDYDEHIDHRAVTLAFEKAMGAVLKREPDYAPLVFKSYAYNTSWFADPDFYGTNIQSTMNVFDDHYDQSPAVYRWEERLRLPVGDYTLSRSMVSSRAFQTLALYQSQDAALQAAGIINGDKVSWFRSTESLCYEADIQVSSGNGSLLNDFMLLENLDLRDSEHQPYDGTWVPTDEERTVTVTFQAPQKLTEIRIYDNPSPVDNVLAGKVLLSDGSEIGFGPLDIHGAAVTIPVDRTDITDFTVALTETEGELAGLTEVEAFSKIPEHGLRFVKFMDSQDNFTYDYWISSGLDTELGIYTSGLTNEEQQKLSFACNNPKCDLKFENSVLQVLCPKGERMELTVSVEGTDLSDTIRVHNPRRLQRLHFRFGQTLEEQVFWKYRGGLCERSAALKLFKDMC